MLEERFCHYCVTNLKGVSIGDELHNLSSCPKFDRYRSELTNCLDITSEQIVSVLYNPYQVSVSLQATARQLARLMQRCFSRLPDQFLAK